MGFLALHGGLEPATAEIAVEAARRSGASWYVIVQPDDLKHHVPSHEHDPADAPLLAGFLDHVDVVISVHGYWGHDDLHDALLVGGRRPRAGRLARDAAAGRAARLPRRRRPRRHPASAAGRRPAQPGEPRGAAACRWSCRTRCAPSARTAGASGGASPRPHRGAGRCARRLRARQSLRERRLAVVGGNSLLGSRFGADAPELTVDDGTRRRRRPRPRRRVPAAAARLGRRTRHPTSSTTSRTSGRSSRSAATACSRSTPPARCATRSASVSFLLADDFVALGALPSTFADERGHRVPGFHAAWRDRMLDAWHATTDVPLHDGGVYWQVTGPRLETAAEIRVFSQHADVVGMTMASECTVAGELGLPYASVCVVDNLANGIGRARR